MRITRTQRFFWLIIVATVLLGASQAISKSTSQQPGDLIINEVVAANQAGLTDEDGDHSDWIELYNQSNRAINLAGLSLTDDPDRPQKWTLPDVTLASQAYLLVFASGKDRKPTQPASELHTNFKLSRKGEFLGLYNIFESQFIHTPTLPLGQTLPQQFNDVAYGRYDLRQSGEVNEPLYAYLAAPTPGQPNDSGVLWMGLVERINFSHQRGFYEAPFRLNLAAPTPGATIRYTTDGSQPTESHGTLYTGSLNITTTTLLRAAAFKPNFRPSSIETHTYIFLDGVLGQTANPPGFPQIWGGYKGAAVIADYEMDPEIVNDPRYSGVIREALISVPTISIVTDKRSFHDLYANPRRRGRAWERPASVEFIKPDDDQRSFQISAGLRTQGELGRSEFMPKHAFRLFFRDDYGAAKLKYPLFPNSPVEEFDTLVLRSGVNRSYAGYPKRQDEIKLTTYTRDEWLRASQIAMSGSGSHGLFVHLYLNGLYWGLYNVVERPDDSFMASYFGGAESDWQTISHEETVSTSNEPFKTLHELASDGHLKDPDRYDVINSYLDVPHFIDYLILNWYAGNLDWGFNNWYVGAQNASGPVRYFVWDGERTWFDGAEIFMEKDEYLERPNLVKQLFGALLDNPDFKLALADRLYRHLFNDGALTDENSRVRWLSINKTIEQAIIGESARWGDTRSESPLTQDDWLRARSDVLAQMEGNATRLINLARDAGYYPAVNPPQFNQTGGQIGPDVELKMALANPSDGIIFYTSDGSDPRVPVTGAVATTAHIYHAPLVLTRTVHIKARVFGKGTWSALNEARFSLDNDASDPLQITEIMYNPVGGDDYEFIELKNTGQVDLNLSNMSFEGIDFTFPSDVSLRPGGMTVLVRNPEAFATRYPDVVIGGTYGGRLSNKGEQIAIKDVAGNKIVSLQYDDENGWPVSSDGRGDSLVRVDLGQELNDPDSWRASTNPNGSPGIDDPVVK